MRNPPKLGISQLGKSHGWFRGTMLVLAFVLAFQAFWILTAEFYRPSPVDPSIGSQSVALSPANRHNAHLAALIGYIRGDLWADDLLTYPSVYQRQNNSSTDKPPAIEQIRHIAERALSFSPHDSRTWLALANIDSRFDGLNKRAPNDLRMSYYTGANEIDLIPLRLYLAVRFSAISDADFQQLVLHDIRTVVTRKPELKSAILDAYRNALPVGQDFIEQAIKDMDPTLLTTLRSK